jgi:hypothetical protein
MVISGFFVLWLLSLVSGGVINDYSSSASSENVGLYDGGSSSYEGNSNCQVVYEPQMSEHCEEYVEKVCTESQKESCSDVEDQTCRGVVTSKQIRKCFNVTEERCNLKEDVSFETIQVPFVVQKCQKISERVCDTVYETDSNTREGQQCLTLENPVCHNVDNVVYDKTCRTVSTFDCENNDYGSMDPSGSRYGSGVQYGSSPQMANPSGSQYGNDGSTKYNNQLHKYGSASPKCQRREEEKCYKTPRTVTISQCSRRADKVCETLEESVPFVAAKQSCRNEDKKVCDLEERAQSKQVKKYVYRKVCQPVPRQVCELVDQKILVPSCVQSVRKECSFTPVKSCVDEPKRHCFQVTRQVKREKCDKSY